MDVAREIVQRGAEAILYREDSTLVKDRVAKGYRLPELDARIRKLRTRGEARLLDTAARAGIDVPRVVGAEENVLRMEFIDGRRVKDCLNGMGQKERDRTCMLIGEALARLHNAGICHGDFTTSNMILKDVGSLGECASAEGKGSQNATEKDAYTSCGGTSSTKAKLYVIDFGLGKLSAKVEDQAVDLYLLYEALKAAHFEYLSRSWQYILKSYSAKFKAAEAGLMRRKSHGLPESEGLGSTGGSKGADAVMQRFRLIEKRRRYKGE